MYTYILVNKIHSVKKKKKRHSIIVKSIQIKIDTNIIRSMFR